MALTSILLFLISRRVWSRSPSSPVQRGGENIVMTHALLLAKWMSVTMAFPALPAMTLPLSSLEVKDCGPGHPHPTSRRKVHNLPWPLPFFP